MGKDVGNAGEPERGGLEGSLNKKKEKEEGRMIPRQTGRDCVAPRLETKRSDHLRF